MPWKGSCLGYFRRPRVGSGASGGAAKSSVLLCAGEILFSLFGYIWVFGTRVGVSGTVTRSRERKTRKPFTTAADLLEYHPLSSMDRKLNLNSQGPGPRSSSATSKTEGWGGG